MSNREQIIKANRNKYCRPIREVERIIQKQMGWKLKRRKTRRKLRRK